MMSPHEDTGEGAANQDLNNYLRAVSLTIITGERRNWVYAPVRR